MFRSVAHILKWYTCQIGVISRRPDVISRRTDEILIPITIYKTHNVTGNSKSTLTVKVTCLIRNHFFFSVLQDKLTNRILVKLPLSQFLKSPNLSQLLTLHGIPWSPELIRLGDNKIKEKKLTDRWARSGASATRSVWLF